MPARRTALEWRAKPSHGTPFAVAGESKTTAHALQILTRGSDEAARHIGEQPSAPPTLRGQFGGMIIQGLRNCYGGMDCR